MLALFAERGGDPDRVGKRDGLDPLLWRARRDGEPSWPGGGLGDGRPGWHIECADHRAAAPRRAVRRPGRRDRPGLPAPRDERRPRRGADRQPSRSRGPSSTRRWSGYDGEKMSKSKGNLVLVSELRADGRRPDGDPAGPPRAPLPHAMGVDRRRARAGRGPAGDLAGGAVDQRRARRRRTVAEVRARLADDLDTPGALAAVDAWVARSLSEGGSVEGAPGIVGPDLRRPARRPGLAPNRRPGPLRPAGVPSSPRRRR